MILKLCSKVLLPVFIGQCLRLTNLKSVYTRNSKTFKRVQESILLGIVWNAFCNAFSKGFGIDVKSGIALLTLLPAMHLFSMFALFTLFRQDAWNLSRGEIVASVFCASHKTLAFGLPLVKTVFEGNSNLAMYCAPIMLIHPLQLVFGLLLTPKFEAYIKAKSGN
eukprot:CAMPEP_0171314170 /NCGR_PEP_ID=MMETSP0816-20121228/49512_1 /TAXON_ID=420281 /ORGANISM="Proboscia inermis, Strain CCAP1064/1" /LENGTH=164 /DNA_ID=CAMNT_0011802727 /DNA_START=80 /DNA_END=574 /DNA_ORIENTATION=+